MHRMATHGRDLQLNSITDVLSQSYESKHVGLSENSVPLHPMVLLIIIPMKNGYFIGGIPYFQTYPYSGYGYSTVLIKV